MIRIRTLALCLGWFISAPALAEVAVDPTHRDLGEVRTGVPAQATFTITNTGPEFVELLDIERSCGCLAPTFAARRLAAGEKTTLSVKLRTLGQKAGPRDWPMSLVCRQGEVVKKLPLLVRARLRHEITLEPPQLALYVAGALEQVIVLTDHRDRPLQVQGVRATSEGLRATAEKAAGATTRLRLIADGTRLPSGRTEQVLRIQTDDPVYGELEVPVLVVKEAARIATWTPETPRVVLAPGQAKGSALVRVTSAKVIRKVESADAGICCTWALGEDGEATLRIVVERSRYRAESLQASVRVHFEGGETTAIAVLVQVE